MLNKNFFFRSLLLALLVVAVPQSQAGLLDHFKNLVDQTGKAMENYNQNMWLGEASLGKTAISSVKGAFGQEGVGNKLKGLNDAVDKIAAAQTNAQNGALTDVKAILTTLKEIVLYLPKKLQALFNKAMDKVRSFIQRLNDINNGGGAGGGGGGAAAAAVADAGGGFGGDSELENALEAPSAPHASASVPEIDGAFETMISSASKIEESGKRSEAYGAIQASFLKGLELALQADDRDAAKALWAEAPSVYRSGAQKMHSSVEKVANASGSDLAKQFSKASARLAKSIKVHASLD